MSNLYLLLKGISPTLSSQGNPAASPDHMKLSTFIITNMEEVLAEWDRFAKTLELEGVLSRKEVRDHAEQILRAIALDIDTQQSPEQQHRKSQGLSPQKAVASGASIHGTARQHDGFTLLQLTAEFRALRATVQRLWFALGNALTPAHSADLIRFNEAIDQALAESVVTYAAQAARTKDTFLAILGHDLRNPLATIALSGSLLGQPGMTKEAAALLAPRIKRSASMMNSMINDLLEYARAELGAKCRWHSPGRTCRISANPQSPTLLPSIPIVLLSFIPKAPSRAASITSGCNRYLPIFSITRPNTGETLCL